ncbi:hypothetical protein HanRHA438_Chr04g0181371 [Helianthus annuus]|nr:hypothetical protein HanRHA438_Chr04g0181371 [Helianthus annuus]
MAKTVLEGLKASTSNFMTFRVSAKLTEDFTMLVNVPRFLKTKFGGLRVKINGKNLACEEQGPNLPINKRLLMLNRSLRTVYRDLTVRITCPDAANSRTEVFGSEF